SVPASIPLALVAPPFPYTTLFRSAVARIQLRAPPDAGRGLKTNPRLAPQIVCHSRFARSAWTPYGPKLVRNGPTLTPNPTGKAGERIGPIRSGIQSAELRIHNVKPQMSPFT